MLSAIFSVFKKKPVKPAVRRPAFRERRLLGQRRDYDRREALRMDHSERRGPHRGRRASDIIDDVWEKTVRSY